MRGKAKKEKEKDKKEHKKRKIARNQRKGEKRT